MIQIPRVIGQTEFERLKAELLVEWGALGGRKAKRRRKLRHAKGVARVALLLFLAVLTEVLFVGLATNGQWAAALRLLLPWVMFAARLDGYVRALRRGQGGAG